MARGELLRKLFRSHRHADDSEFHAVALEIIAEEERKNNHRLARDLMRILENNVGSSLTGDARRRQHSRVPTDQERQVGLVDLRHPDRSFEEIQLSSERRGTIDRVLEEYRKSELLRLHGLCPSSKLLFCGPPGCGKTLCAEIVASELGLPLLYTRFDAVVSSYLGETAANLRKVFDYASNGRWVLFFDEFDAIGKARTDESEHGELKRVVNSFLQLLDGFTSQSIVIAATNHEQLLDPALWRRFDEIVLFPRPSVHEIRSLIRMKLKNFPKRELDVKKSASRLRGMSHADVERICFDSIKDAILHGMDAVDQATFNRATEQHQHRLAITEGAMRTPRSSWPVP